MKGERTATIDDMSRLRLCRFDSHLRFRICHICVLCSASKEIRCKIQWERTLYCLLKRGRVYVLYCICNPSAESMAG